MIHRVAVGILLLLAALSSPAATFTVSSSADGGPGTLRQAILDANAAPGPHQIVFTAASVVVTSMLPPVTETVAIDGSVGGGRVAIVGTDVSSTGLYLGLGSTLTRVDVQGFAEAVQLVDGVTVTDSVIAKMTTLGSNNVIEQNTIGRVKVLFGANNRIGSIGAGNTIGPAGFTMFPDTGSVLVISAGHAFIEGNEIASDWLAGIALADTRTPFGATITGNTIHGQSTGITVWPSGTPGQFFSARILGNSIYDVGMPIDLFDSRLIPPTGPTANDPAPDADDGGNHLQNYPVLDSAIVTGAGMTVSGSLTSAPLTTYRIELFANPLSAPDEARTPLTTFDVTTDATGTAAFTQVLAAQTGTLTSTATNLTTNDTSEVSAPVVIDASGQLSFNPVSYTANEGELDVTLTVVRTGGNTNTVTVNYATVNGTATAPSDYATTTGMLTFDPGVTSQTIVIPIAGDQIAEPAETFTVVLSTPTNGATIGNGTATVTIAAEAGGVPIPTASTWALIALATALAVLAAGALRA